MKEFRFRVFGTPIAVVGTAGSWRAFYLGSDGKRRPADFIVPADVAEQELAEYLGDLFHENATPRNGTVERIGADPAASWSG
jgi:hypothetical protein